MAAAKNASPKKGASPSPKKTMTQPLDGSMADEVVEEATIEEEMDEEQMTSLLK